MAASFSYAEKIDLIIVGQFIFATSFLISVWFVYNEPYAGAIGVLTGTCYALTGFVTIYGARRSPNQINYGIVLGVSVIFIFIALEGAIFWGQYSNCVLYVPTTYEITTSQPVATLIMPTLDPTAFPTAFPTTRSSLPFQPSQQQYTTPTSFSMPTSGYTSSPASSSDSGSILLSPSSPPASYGLINNNKPVAAPSTVTSGGSDSGSIISSSSSPPASYGLINSNKPVGAPSTITSGGSDSGGSILLSPSSSSSGWMNSNKPVAAAQTSHRPRREIESSGRQRKLTTGLPASPVQCRYSITMGSCCAFSVLLFLTYIAQVVVLLRYKDEILSSASQDYLPVVVAPSDIVYEQHTDAAAA